MDALPRGSELRVREQSLPLEEEMASTLRARPPSPPINQVLVEEDDPAADDEGDEGRLGRADELCWSCAEPVGEVFQVTGSRREFNK